LLRTHGHASNHSKTNDYKGYEAGFDHSVKGQQISESVYLFRSRIFLDTHSFEKAWQSAAADANAASELNWALQAAEKLNEKARSVRVGLPPRLTQTVKTLFADRCENLDRQDHCNAF
jgi:cobalamin biosynthesis protein CobT